MADFDADYLDGLIESWRLNMQVAEMSKSTITLYVRGVTAYREWCADVGEPVTFGKDHVMQFLVACKEMYGRSKSTTKDYLKGVRQFGAWATEEGEFDAKELREIPMPNLGKTVLKHVNAEAHEAMLATCDLKTFYGKRDYAILRLLKASGARASELVGLQLADVNVKTRRAFLHGKGSKERWTAFDPETALAIDRYLRARRTFPGAGLSALWLARGGRALSYSGVDTMLERRAKAAGVWPVHAHMWRHLWARTYLRDGGDRGDLKVLGGWTSNEMVEHYTEEENAERALEAYDRIYGNRT